MNSREYLRKARNLNARINAHIREKEELESMALSISSPRFTADRVQTNRSTDAPYTRTVEKIWALEERINREIDELVDLRVEIHDAISRMDDPEEQLVLYQRYCEGLSWEEIESDLNVSLRTAYRIHASALRNFIVPN